ESARFGRFSGFAGDGGTAVLAKSWASLPVSICYCCSATVLRFVFRPWSFLMTVIKSGDLVVLRSGGPVMTVDTVNTSIFDDNEITGVFCAWFDGEKLQRVRFDHRAIAPAPEQRVIPQD